MEAKMSSKERFEVELEFLQLLANPTYVHYLATSGMLHKPEFVGYLRYLLYWKEPKYAIFITYPACLAMLDLLQDARFRDQMINPQIVERIHSQQFYFWRYNFDNRLKVGEKK